MSTSISSIWKIQLMSLFWKRIRLWRQLRRRKVHMGTVQGSYVILQENIMGSVIFMRRTVSSAVAWRWENENTICSDIVLVRCGITLFLSWFAWFLHLVPDYLTFFVEFGKVKMLDADVVGTRYVVGAAWIIFILYWIFFVKYGIMKMIQSGKPLCWGNGCLLFMERVVYLIV